MDKENNEIGSELRYASALKKVLDNDLCKNYREIENNIDQLKRQNIRKYFYATLLSILALVALFCNVWFGITVSQILAQISLVFLVFLLIRVDWGDYEYKIICLENKIDTTATRINNLVKYIEQNKNGEE